MGASGAMRGQQTKMGRRDSEKMKPCPLQARPASVCGSPRALDTYCDRSQNHAVSYVPAVVATGRTSRVVNTCAFVRRGPFSCFNTPDLWSKLSVNLVNVSDARTFPPRLPQQGRRDVTRRATMGAGINSIQFSTRSHSRASQQP